MMRDLQSGAPRCDAELLRLVGSGDLCALEELYDRYCACGYGLAMRMLGESLAAEECVAAAFLTFRQRQPRGPQPVEFLPQLLRTVHEMAARHLRAQPQRRKETSKASPARVPAEHERRVEKPMLPNESAPDRTAEAARTALGRLSHEQRILLELAYFGCMTQTEIAAYLQQPLDAVQATLRAGMLDLQAALGGVAAQSETSFAGDMILGAEFSAASG